ncbi:MAG: bifunctional phosphopantothenoylcysteine decarboxylase/phosphopantothenate--cysteine ligase CoaBC [Ignavibacteriae bacterium]|nr:MAG: bifunctional phosphopantothenoylcysteine decarboxylase/phosphopantothenate--cysteine ligase CoaBC [Ignavibacteriota bacterium]
MAKNKILLKISGSIAAYKAASLISKLVQNNYEVQVAASQDALNFIGKATLEGLSGKEVFIDSYEDGKMMSHINLMKWADLIILAPATGNTINKLANGIADNLITSLFLAFDFSKPYLIAPAMNTKMFKHPVTKESLKKLRNFGIKILPTQEGYLACGDIGKGKMLEPKRLFKHIENELNKKINNNKKIIITAGGTKEYIDGIRFLTNLSTGNTAAQIAQYFIDNGYDVTYVHSIDSITPIGNFRSYNFTDFGSLHNLLKHLLTNNYYDLIIHNAAISDYTIKEIIVNNKNLKVPLKNKISSSNKKLELVLTPSFKIINLLEGYSKNKSIKLVSFKFTSGSTEKEIIQNVNKLLTISDLVVQNDLSTRKNNVQEEFNFYNKSGKIFTVDKAQEISKVVEKILKLNESKK